MAGYAKPQRNTTLPAKREVLALTEKWHRWYDVGDTLNGVYVKTTVIPGRDEDRNRIVHTFRTEDGYVSTEIYGRAGGMFLRCAEPGTEYIIVYKGTDKLKDGREYPAYSIEEILT